MRINFDRLSQLAGLPSNGSNTRKSLYEGAMGQREGEGEQREGEQREGAAFDNADLKELDELEMEEMEAEGMHMQHEDEEMPMDELVEIDEVMLVQELRRAKRIMNENKRRRMNESRKRNSFEAQLKQVIDEEVQNVMSEMNLSGQWVYGDKRPSRSRKGYTHQGSFLPGIGFRR